MLAILASAIHATWGICHLWLCNMKNQGMESKSFQLYLCYYMPIQPNEACEWLTKQVKNAYAGTQEKGGLAINVQSMRLHVVWAAIIFLVNSMLARLPGSAWEVRVALLTQNRLNSAYLNTVKTGPTGEQRK